MTLSVGNAAGTATAVAVGNDSAGLDLPQLQLPYGFPPFERSTHDFTPMPLYGDTKMMAGAARRRRVYLTAPRVVSVSLELSLAQSAQFDDWFENALNAGDQFFSAQVANQGPGLLWWKARVISPYTATYLGGLWWRVSMKLMLFNKGAFGGPVPTTLRGGVSVALAGSAAPVITYALSGGVTLALLNNTSVQALSGGVVVALLDTPFVPWVGQAAGTSVVLGERPGVAVGDAGGSSTATGVSNFGVGSSDGSSTADGQATGSSAISFELREDGFYILRESGFKLIREL